MKHKASTGQKQKTSMKGVPDKTAWRCESCGKIQYGDEAPDECPYCVFPNHSFKKVD
jgi:rubrerythrin